MAAASEREASPTAAAEHRARTIARFVAAAQSTSPADTEAALDAIFAAGSFEAIVDDLLMPATAALGEAWAAGTLSVAAEHAASAAVGRRLAAVYQAAGVPARPSVLVGLPPGGASRAGHPGLRRSAPSSRRRGPLPWSRRHRRGLDRRCCTHARARGGGRSRRPSRSRGRGRGDRGAAGAGRADRRGRGRRGRARS